MAGDSGSCFLYAVLFLLSGLLNTNSQAEARDTEGPCFSELGCFPQVAPWYTIIRPFPSPFEPTKINTSLTFYSRTQDGIAITLWPSISLNEAKFSADRPTALMTHGFASSGDVEWLANLKDKYLKNLDANIFIIDWAGGAQHMNYMQVAANTRVVGAEIVRLMEWLINNHGLNTSTVHLLGHSLGAHICSYVAKRVPGIAHITGFDPAQPGFENAGTQVRLDKSDADFVEILHTNAMPLIPLLGFGLMNPRGHVDFYINGGTHQPGCKTALDIISHLGGMVVQLQSTKDVFNATVDDLAAFVGCSHGRSYFYYTEALDSPNCTFWGHKTNLARRVLNGATGGALAPLFQSMDDCTEETCLPMGLNTASYPARGAFSIVTNKEQPFCKVADEASNAVLQKLASSVQGTKELLSQMSATAQNLTAKAKEIGNVMRSRFFSLFG